MNNRDLIALMSAILASEHGVKYADFRQYVVEAADLLKAADDELSKRRADGIFALAEERRRQRFAETTSISGDFTKR